MLYKFPNLINHSRKRSPPPCGSSQQSTSTKAGASDPRGVWGGRTHLGLEVYIVKILKIPKFNYFFFSIGPPLGKSHSLAPVQKCDKWFISHLTSAFQNPPSTKFNSCFILWNILFLNWYFECWSAENNQSYPINSSVKSYSLI